MSISPFTAALEKARGGGKKEHDWWYFTILPAIIAIVVVFLLMAIFLTPVAKENKSRLEEQFRQNRIEAVQEYEAADGKKESIGAGGVRDTATPAPARNPSAH